MEEKRNDSNGSSLNMTDGLGIAKDLVTVANPSVDAGFGIARTCTGFGFSIAKGILNGLSTVGKNISGEYNPVSVGLDVASGIVDMSGKLTDGILMGSHEITKTSLTASDGILSALGGKDGASLIAMGCSKETVGAILFVSKLVKEFGEGLDLSPKELYDTISLIMSLEEGCGKQIVQPLAEEQKVDEDLFDFLSWALGCYGKLIMKHLLSHSPTNERGDSDGFRRAHEKLTGGRIITSKLGKGTFEPTYVVGFDRERSSVVVAFRGTLSPGDALTDLVCEHEPYTLFSSIPEAYVHKGFHKSAIKMCLNLRPTVLQALDVSMLVGEWTLDVYSPIFGGVIKVSEDRDGASPLLFITTLQTCKPLSFVIPPATKSTPFPHPSYTCNVGSAYIAIKLRRDSFQFPKIDISVLTDTITKYTARRTSAQYAAPFRLVCCGHSLGAAVASVVASNWLGTKSLQPYRVVCFSFNSPCVFSLRLARHPIFLESISSIVIGHDIVSRLSIGSAWELRELIKNIQTMKRDRPTEYKELQDSLNLQKSSEERRVHLRRKLSELQPVVLAHQKLFPAGRTFYIPSGIVIKPENQGQLVTEFNAECLSRISIHPSMLTDHMVVFKTLS